MKFSIIIILTHDAKKLQACISAIKSNTDLSDGEIVVGTLDDIKKTNGEFIIILHDDVLILDKRWLPILLKPFENPKIGIVGPDKQVVFDRRYISFCCCAIRKEVFEEIELDETFANKEFEDADFCFRAEDAGWLMYEINISPININKGNRLEQRMGGFPAWHENKEIHKNLQTIAKYDNVIRVDWQFCMQKKTELNMLQRYLKGCKIERVLEIGTQFGGTALLWAKIVAPHNGIVYCADLFFNWSINTNFNKSDNMSLLSQKQVYKGLPEEKFIKEFSGNSHDEDFKVRIHKEVGCVDMLFIDGDHSYEGVKDDFYSYRDLVKPGGLVVFHDIVDSYYHRIQNVYVERFWSETKNDYKYHEFIDNATYGCAPELSMGIGVIEVPEHWQVKPPIKQSSKLLSIVIPTYNYCDDLLKPCLEGILKYTDIDFEIIISANGCTDNTREYVTEISKNRNVKLVWNNEALGATKALNEGIKVASGKFILLLNNDTILLEQPKNQWIDMLLEPFKDETVGIVGPDLVQTTLWINDKVVLKRNLIAFHCAVVRADLFHKIGLLDEIFSPGRGEDNDFCFRAQDRGYKIHRITNFPMKHLDGMTTERDPATVAILKQKEESDTGWAYIIMRRYTNLNEGDRWRGEIEHV